MAKAGNNYELTWDSKPLGFSIVMDTSGKNAYVSSIQAPENIEKGLRLAAQIISIQGPKTKKEEVSGWKHEKILQLIKSTAAPLTLGFKQRTFANDKEKDPTPEVLKFEGAPAERANRVDGYFELSDTKHNGRCTWIRKDDETDRIVVWYWPKDMAQKKIGGDRKTGLWMISRESQKDSDKAYACVESDARFPTEIGKNWQVWGTKGFVESEINITQAEL